MNTRTIERKKTLKLERFDVNNLQQISFLKHLLKSTNVNNHIEYEINKMINQPTDLNTNDQLYKAIKEKAMTFMIKDRLCNKYIGFFTTEITLYDKTPAPAYIDYVVVPKYQSYETYILELINDLIFKANFISKTVLELQNTETSKISNAEAAGFEINYDILETFRNEGYHCIPYSKSNPNYVYPTSNSKTDISLTYKK